MRQNLEGSDVAGSLLMRHTVCRADVVGAGSGGISSQSSSSVVLALPCHVQRKGRRVKRPLNSGRVAKSTSASRDGHGDSDVHA
jgi:hypothetical protein